MAGLEQLEIHSRSYLIRWVNASVDHTIAWSVQPHKKSINFGLYKHPGSGPLTPNLPSAGTFEITPQSLDSDSDQGRRPGTSRNDHSTAEDKLKKLGLLPINWIGKCEADRVTSGDYGVGPGGGGMYALIFDNTFSKQVSKTVTFVLLTYPTSSPPKTNHQLNYPSGASRPGAGSLGRALSGELDNRSHESIPHSTGGRSRASSDTERPNSRPGSEQKYKQSSGFFTGILHKRRRKRHQGFARRFFSLDIRSSTLSYYHDRQSSALRGAVPLSLAVIAANEKRREISVDSGAEVWHLRAGNWKDFYAWKDALEQASNQPAADSETLVSDESWPSKAEVSPETAWEQEWVRVEALVGQIVGIKDAVRRLAQQPSHTTVTQSVHNLAIHDSSLEPSLVDGHAPDYFAEREKRPFWKRKASSGSSSPAMFQRAPSGQLNVPSSGRLSTPSPSAASSELRDHCRVIQKDLDSVIAEFQKTIAASKQRRQNSQRFPSHRHSIASTLHQEFFDAEDGQGRSSQVFQLQDSDGEHSESANEVVSDAESSDDDEPPTKRMTRHIRTDTTLFPSTAKSLKPLPIATTISRRQTVPKATMLPPSLVAFFRKNVGKDLSTVSMPVSANEPLSLLQRSSEMLEYASLLTTAASLPPSSTEALAHITAFAISALSSSRVPTRAIRKPFNPMLGETFELIRSDAGGYRLIAEKVSHRPVQMALQAEGPNWTLTVAPRPTQKFWGKSVEIIQEGTVRVVLHKTGECFSWAPAACTLKNLLAGEKYVEPSGSMTVVNESTGAKALATFKAKGLFGGRSEEVTVDFDGEGAGMRMDGRWTQQLSFEGKTIWQVGELVEDAPARYGFTKFAASLNEISEVEKGKMPLTDSRGRADQRSAEEGRLDEAEACKARLEEGQRTRRREMEEKGESWTPRWFRKVEGGNDAWGLRNGRDGYWECRERGEWEGVVDVLGIGAMGDEG
ncbi:MAG: hypothetical protein M1814_004984 [Vezdaea aestivalis]|nr:MAG: hypothetical protein M1814_004984 [Vezdaea aestivalis]